MSKTKNTGKNKAAIIRARTKASSKAARPGKTPANIKRFAGEKLTDTQVVQLANAGRNLKGERLKQHATDHGLTEPIVVEANNVKIHQTMTQIEFDVFKAEAKKKKRGFKKYAESKGWEYRGSGDFKESHQDFVRQADLLEAK